MVVDSTLPDRTNGLMTEGRVFSQWYQRQVKYMMELSVTSKLSMYKILINGSVLKWLGVTWIYHFKVTWSGNEIIWTNIKPNVRVCVLVYRAACGANSVSCIINIGLFAFYLHDPFAWGRCDSWCTSARCWLRPTLGHHYGHCDLHTCDSLASLFR